MITHQGDLYPGYFSFQTFYRKIKPQMHAVKMVNFIFLMSMPVILYINNHNHTKLCLILRSKNTIPRLINELFNVFIRELAWCIFVLYKLALNILYQY